MKELISGVPLAQYAAVTAALSEAFPLKTVLAVEGITPARWAEADHGWTQRLADDPALMVRFEAELAAAQRRLSAEGSAAKKRGAKVRLIPSGAGVAPAPATTGEVAQPAVELGGSRTSQPSPAPTPSPALVTAAPRDEEPARQSRPAGLPEESLEELPRAVAPPSPPQLVPAPEPPPRASPAVGRQVTLLAVEVPTAVLPFRAPQAAPDVQPPSPRAGRQTTLPAVEVPTAVLPFRAAPRPAALAPEAPPPAREVGESPPAPPTSEDAGFEGPTTIFRFSAVLSQEPEEARARSAALLEGLDGGGAAAPSSTAVALPSEGEHTVMLCRPDVPAVEEAPISSDRRPADATVSPFPSGGWGFVRPSSPGPSPGAQPPMSLERHASLCLEIAVDPARTADALARYQVSAADKQRADEYYRARILADPELHAQWNRVYGEAYRAWYTSRSDPG